MGLRFKLFIPTLVLLVTVTSLIHFYWLPYYIASEAEDQFEYERAYAKLLGDTLISDLLSNDRENISSILDRVLEHHDYWHAIRLYKDQQRVYPLSDKILPEGITTEPLQYPIRLNDKNIANMTVWIDTKSSNAETIEHVYYLEQLVLSLLLGISLVAMLFQDRWIRKPINKLASLTREVSAGNYDTDLSYNSKDEVGILANSFNAMREQISKREKKLKYHSYIQDTIKHIQDTFILNINDEHVFTDLLEQILKLLESEHGFIGEVLYDKNGKPYIKTFCASNMFIDKSNGENDRLTQGEGIEFHSLNSLPGKVLATGQPFISNTPATDAPKSKAMNMQNFFGLPISGGNKLTGVLGVANRHDGYSASLYDNFQALLVTMNGLIIAYRDEKELHESETRFRSVVDKAADGMITINSRGIIQGCNAAAVKMFGHSLKDMLGQNVSMLMPEPYHSQHDQYLGNYLTTGEKNIIGINREVKGLQKDGTTFPLELAVSEVELGGERMFLGIAHDITQRVHAEQTRLRYSKSLEKFHKITSRLELSFDQKIGSLLKLGQEIFELPLAILSRVEDDRYIIEYVDGPAGSPKTGTELLLGATYCCHTLAANKPTGFDHVGKSAINSHPCYENFGFETYIGCPLHIGDKLYGTLNFSGPDIRKEPFTPIDYSIIRLFTQWIGTEIARTNAETELELAYIEVNQVNSELEKLSRTDGLTGLANRRHFDEVLSQELNRAIRYHSPLTLIICDIDYFKKYNDTYGHQAGDACLKKVSKAIRSSFGRAGELVARYGGEEFAVIIPEIDMETGIKLAEKMRRNVIELNLAHEASSVARNVTISAGLATLVPDQNTTMSVLIEHADNELYKAKETGRNNVQWFH
jgi:diguanylate cyclase (GGDEF)-like protein/PAS domain S-box-containing protein